MAYKQNTGVYMIQSLSQPRRIYVGSALSIRKRWNQHRRLLRNKKHHSQQLQRHYDKYGIGDLVFETIEEFNFISKEHLLAREQGWYERFTFDDREIPYFNNDKLAGSRLGSKASLETRLLQSKAKKGRKQYRRKGYKMNLTPEQHKRRSERQMGEKNHQFGRTWTEDQRRRQSEKHIGKRHSPETIKKMSRVQSMVQRNYKPSPEECKRRSIANTGAGNPMFGKHMSDEAKFRLREMKGLTKLIKMTEEREKQNKKIA